MRAIYIIGILLTVGLFATTIYYTEEYSHASYNYYDSYDSYSYYDTSDSRSDVTFEWASVSLIFFLYFIAMDILGLIKVKKPTTKVLGIIGLCFSGLMLLWDFAVLSSPGGISLNEAGPGWAIYCIIMLAFSIVGLIQAVKYSNRATNDDTLDDLLNEETV